MNLFQKDEEFIVQHEDTKNVGFVKNYHSAGEKIAVYYESIPGSRLFSSTPVIESRDKLILLPM